MAQDTLPVGTVIRTSSRDHYIIESLLGKGGFSTIYLVRDQRVRQNRFALKEVKNLSTRERERFTFECEVLKRLDHQALPRVYRVFEDLQRNQAYVLMDYIEGSNLELLRRHQPKQRFSVPQVLNIMRPIFDAVVFLHSQSPPIVHRDIKPANIIVPANGDDAVLVDFSIAKEYESEETTTAVRHATPGFAAPEQYGIGTTPRTDIYSLGATLCALLTGVTPADALYRMIRLGENEPDPLIRVDHVNPTVSRDVADVIHRAMSLNSKARYSSVLQFWQALNGDTAEHPSHSLRAVSSSHDYALTIPKDTVKSTVTISLPKEKHTVYFRKMAAILLILLALLTGSGVGIHSLLSAANSQRSRSETQVRTQLTRTAPTFSPRATATSAATSASVVYPPLAQRYSGTIAYLTATTKTNMTLSDILQSDGHIHGYFTGLGVSGSFQGTVATSEQVQFQVTTYSGKATLTFEGTIQFGGNIAGTYQILNQNKQFTGVFGLWSVDPVPSG